jgi:hypothetical protein
MVLLKENAGGGDSSSQYFFTVGSIDAFERKLEQAQYDLGLEQKDFVPVVYRSLLLLSRSLLLLSGSLLLLNRSLLLLSRSLLLLLYSKCTRSLTFRSRVVCSNETSWGQELLKFAPTLLIIGVWLFVMRQMGGGGMGGAGGGGPGNIFRVGKAKPVIVKEGQVSFDTSRSLLTLVGLFLVGLF